MPQNYISQINGAEISASYALTASYATTATTATNADTASIATTATTATNADTASIATTATNATTSSLISASLSIPATVSLALYNYQGNTSGINYGKLYAGSNTTDLGYVDGVLNSKKLSIGEITNSPTITGGNFLYGVNTNSSLFTSPTNTGSLQLGRSIYLTSPSNGAVGIYGGLNVTITSSRVNLVGLNTSLNINASNFTGNTIQATSSQILLDGTHPSGSVLFVTGSVVPTGVPVNLTNEGLNRAAVQFAKSGSGDNYLMYVYIGGRWRSASLV
jgi:hypothetical protein